MRRFLLIAIFLLVASSVVEASCLPPSDPLLSSISTLIGRDPAAAARSAEEVLRSRDDLLPETRGRLLALQAEGYGRLSRAEAARRIALSGLDEALTADSEARVELLWILATNTFRADDLAALKPWVEQLMKGNEAESAKDICLTIALGSIQRMRGDLSEAARLLFNAYRLGRTPALTLAQAEATRLLARLWADAGNDAAALELNRIVIDFEEASGNSFLLDMAHGFRGIYLNNLRRFDEALAELELARVSHRQAGASIGVAYVEKEFCRALVGLGQWDRARPRCERARAEFARFGEGGGLPQTDLLTAEIELAENKVGEARRRLDEIIARGEGPAMVSQFEPFRLRAEANRRLGDLSAALSDLGEYIARYGRWKDSATARQTLVLSAQFANDLQATRAEALQKTLHAERAERRANTQIMIVAVVAMLLVLLILFRMHYLDLRHRRRLIEIANTDALTGISNRRHILERAKERLAAASDAGRAFSVALLDLDHFKTINDNYGHQVGDTVLKRVATTAAARLPADASIGRWGGEEFLVVFDGHGLEACAAHLERLRLDVRQIWAQRDAAMPIDFSAGLAGNDDPHLTLEQMVERADKALYRAKAGGRGRTCLSRPGPSIVSSAIGLSEQA